MQQQSVKIEQGPYINTNVSVDVCNSRKQDPSYYSVVDPRISNRYQARFAAL